MDKESRFIFCVAAIIENQNNEILLLRRSPGNFPENIWDVVGGRKEQFENPFDALFREVKEETGITELEIIKLIDIFSWFQKDENRDMIGITFWCKTTSLDVTLSAEHSEYIWLKPRKALEYSENHIVESNIRQFIKEKQRLEIE